MKKRTADVSRIVQNGDLHKHFKWLQPPTVVVSNYQGEPMERYIYPIYLEINVGVIYGTLMFWKEMGYPRVVIANSVGGDAVADKAYDTVAIFPIIEKYIKMAQG